MTVNVSTDLTNAHYVDAARNLSSSVSTSTVTFNSFTEAPDNPNGAKIGIGTMADLAKIGNDVAFPLSGDYELLNDLDAIGITFWPIGRLASDPPVANAFTGTFDGRFYTISNLGYDNARNFNDLFISDPTFNPPTAWFDYGLFTQISAASSISNLTLSNMIMECDRASVGGTLSASGLLAGTIQGTITNVHVQGSITVNAVGVDVGISQFGGFCNETSGIFIHCSSDINFTFTHDGSLNRIGGFSGTGTGGTFTDCYAVGTITHNGSGNMTKTGGFSGEVVPNDPIKTWENIYSAIIITEAGTPGATIGGIIGSYDTFFDDIDGHAHIVFEDCFWDGTIDVIGLEDIGNLGDVANVTEETTANMFKQATFTNWDFTEDSGVWEIVEDASYPTFQWQSLAPPGFFITTTFTQGISVDGRLNQLEGEVVNILANGIVQPQQTVINGQINEPVGTLHVGLPYKAVLKPMKPDKATGRIQRVIKVFLKLFRSQGGTMGNDTQNDIEYPATSGFTGRLEIDFPGLYDRQGVTQIEHSDPTPITAISQFLKMRIDE